MQIDKMNWLELRFILDDVAPVWNRLNEDQKRVRLWLEDWQEAEMATRADPEKHALILGMIGPIMLRMPTSWRQLFSRDPFNAVRKLADKFALAANFERYITRRNLRDPK